jgi:hypothetical protein
LCVGNANYPEAQAKAEGRRGKARAQGDEMGMGLNQAGRSDDLYKQQGRKGSEKAAVFVKVLEES